MKLHLLRLPFKSLRRFRWSAAILGLALAAIATGRADDHVTIRLGTLVPTGTAQYAALQALAEQWRNDSGGSVKIVLYPDGRLGGETEMVKKMRIKQLGACLLSAVGLAEIDQGSTGLQEMPLTFHTWAEVDFVREKMRPMLEQRLRAKGYEVLFWADAGWVRYFSKDAGLTPDDFRKMKIFTWSGDVRQSEIMKSIGYRPVGLDTTDILLGLNTDMINAVPLPPMLALAAQLYGPAPHMLDLNWSPIVGAAVIRRDLWEKIPPALQEKFRQSASVTGEKLRAEGRSEDEDCIHVMEGKGLKVTPLTPAAAAAWQQLADEVLPKIRGSVVPAEIFDDVNRYLAEYRKSAPASQP